jgi:cytochrome c553
VILAALLTLPAPLLAAGRCDDEQPTPQVPTNLALCAKLDPIVRHPSALPLDKYEEALNRYVSAMCHRNLADGWAMDKTVRDTGPFVATLADGKWSGSYYGTHAPVLIWYSPEMLAWLRANRPESRPIPSTPAPVPDGAIMVKEMYSPAPAAACRVDNLLRLRPDTQGMAVMVHDSAAARDGWFWAAVGWKGWQPDWPPPLSNSPAQSGFGQYCTNCHASAVDNQTFASLANIKGEPGTVLSFLSQDFYQFQSGQLFTHFSKILPHDRLRVEALRRLRVPPPPSPNPALLQDLGVPNALPGTGLIGLTMPSQSFDHVWIPGTGPDPASTFVTSDQCLGCHTAGGTGLQFEMTTPAPDGKMVNLSPYGTWRTSPMGLAGRDPIFFAQLASETQTFHPAVSAQVQNTCLGCHGILGQRQGAIDAQAQLEPCPDFLRETMNAVPYPDNNPTAGFAALGALARDGVSCTACHRMVLGKADTAKFADAPQNLCVRQRQEALNPGTTDFARTFGGSFFVGDTDQLAGPFQDPKPKPMEHALGITPVASSTISSPEACGTCHTVHLPVEHATETPAYSFEQTTYPEWAFSAYRTGETPDGKLPFGPGSRAQSCQACHMPNTDASGKPFHSKIAGIQEHSNFPQVENALPAADIDLPERSGFARHTLVGLNVFLIEMAAQFSSVLGIATQDPMLGSLGVPPLDLTRAAMLDQAAHGSADISMSGVQVDDAALTATITVVNKSGHKLPSGVGFRRAFIDFRVLDAAGKTLWESGRTNDTGIIVDQNGRPIGGELWWTPNCANRLSQPHQPHYQEITSQNQAEIYQELVTAPPTSGPAHCGPSAPATGPLTTSFLSICGKLKDNRLLPDGFLPLPQRIAISRALGAGADMAEETNAAGVGDDPDYRNGGGDSVRYQIPLNARTGQPASVEATLYYQAIPPFYLQDRLCTAQGPDRDRLAYLASALKLNGAASQWKLRLVSTGPVAVGQ